jgi:tetratricopeptide (TPR) repeat protein
MRLSMKLVVRATYAVFIIGVTILGIRFFWLPPIERLAQVDPKTASDWAQEVLRTGHQLVYYLWVVGALIVGFLAAVAYNFILWLTEHRDILRAMASWQNTVRRAEEAALDAAHKLPEVVFLNFKNDVVRKSYEDDLAKIRHEGSPEEIDLHVQTIALLIDVPAEIYVRLGNYFRYRAQSQSGRAFMTRDLWFAIRRYQRARDIARTSSGAAQVRIFGHASHGIAICYFNMGLYRESLLYAEEAVGHLRMDFDAVPPALVTYGTALLALGRHLESLEVLKDATERSPADVVGHYNLACNLSLLGGGESDPSKRGAYYQQAIATLEKVKGKVGSDMRTINMWATDPDLKSLREDPTFRPILAQTITKIWAAG